MFKLFVLLSEAVKRILFFEFGRPVVGSLDEDGQFVDGLSNNVVNNININRNRNAMSAIYPFLRRHKNAVQNLQLKRTTFQTSTLCSNHE